MGIPNLCSLSLSLNNSIAQPKKMNPNFHGLPPLKRFKLIQQQHQKSDHNPQTSFPLPAKKRKESLDSTTAAKTITTTYCLPAKKRIWAPPPDFILEKNLSSFDLNVEYNPFLEDDKDVKNIEPIPSIESIPEGDEGEADQEEDDDDDGIVCSVCQSTDGDPSDPIVFCDGCDLMVHTTCYGNPLIYGVPEGDWFCTQCLASNSTETQKTNLLLCCLCSINGGAMKQTNDGKWAHIVCALLVPEVFFEDPKGRESINCSKVPNKRWKEKCYICDSRNGCVIDCSEPKCPLAFHVTCGLNEDLSIEYSEKKKTGAIVAGFCKDHTEIWKKQQQTGKFMIVARGE